MSIKLITRRQLTLVANQQLSYPLHIAEKDYFLTLALKQLSASELGNRLVFKGGTALHHHYLPQYRFSEDLDFTSNDQNVTLDDFRKVFQDSQIFTIKKAYVSAHTVKIEKLQYVGVLAQPSHLKIDVSNVKNLALPAKSLKYQNVWELDFKVNYLDLREIAAEKISAINNRARYRDFYDLYFIKEELGVDLAEAINLLAKKDQPIQLSRGNILENYRVAVKEKMQDLSSIFVKKEVSNQDIEKLVQRLGDLSVE